MTKRILAALFLALALGGAFALTAGPAEALNGNANCGNTNCA